MLFSMCSLVYLPGYRCWPDNHSDERGVGPQMNYLRKNCEVCYSRFVDRAHKIQALETSKRVDKMSPESLVHLRNSHGINPH